MSPTTTGGGCVPAPTTVRQTGTNVQPAPTRKAVTPPRSPAADQDLDGARVRLDRHAAPAPDAAHVSGPGTETHNAFCALVAGSSATTRPSASRFSSSGESQRPLRRKRRL